MGIHMIYWAFINF